MGEVLQNGTAGVHPISIIFALKHERSGSLSKVMKILEDNNLNLTHIESRHIQFTANEFLIIFESNGEELYRDAMSAISDECQYFNVIPDSCKGSTWFPRTMADLEVISKQILHYGVELDADHPGFKDRVYRQRRKSVADLSMDYKFGDPIPRIEYTAEEVVTWNTCFAGLKELHATHACREYKEIKDEMFEACGYRLDNVPQLEDVSKYISDRTGFRVRPVAGLLSQRAFLSGLAFKVYHATQYMRHPSVPFYTPEPDICHELIGHLPLFVNPSFAEFVHQIGLASLGASDEYTEKLYTCLWFTVEFGLCKEDGELRAFGGALLSSVDEMRHSMSGVPEIREFEPRRTGLQRYPITEFQPIYYASESIGNARDKITAYAKTIPRSFSVRFNADAEKIEIVAKTAEENIKDNTWASKNLLNEAIYN